MATLMTTSHETGLGMKGKKQPDGVETPYGSFLAQERALRCCTCRTAASLNGGSALALSHLSDHGFVF